MLSLIQAADPLETYLIYYLIVGSIFAILFATLMVNFIDQHAKSASPGFRVMIIPASVVLWPIVMPVSLVKLMFVGHATYQDRKNIRIKNKQAIATDKKSNLVTGKVGMFRSKSVALRKSSAQPASTKSATKPIAKKVTLKKVPATKLATKKVAPKKASAAKPATKKVTLKKASAAKPVAKKVTPKKVSATKPVAKKPSGGVTKSSSKPRKQVK